MISPRLLSTEVKASEFWVSVRLIRLSMKENMEMTKTATPIPVIDPSSIFPWWNKL